MEHKTAILVNMMGWPKHGRMNIVMASGISLALSQFSNPAVLKDDRSTVCAGEWDSDMVVSYKL